jgi:hypothetical protein
MPQDITLEPGCYLDSHRGHYIVRDMIELAIDHGYIVDGFVRFTLDAYDEHYHEDNYPSGQLGELADDALAWLNVGDNSGPERPIKGQNNPPAIPDDYAWDWNDGDFGLYEIEQD